MIKILPTSPRAGAPTADAPQNRQLGTGRIAAGLRVVSASALCLAVVTAIAVVASHALQIFLPGVPSWSIKSAIPLILISTAFGALQFAIPRSWVQRLTGFMAATAFLLWGIEQYVPNRTMAGFIDDLVVLLFVLDLALVIRGQLKSAAADVR
jgi:hypothetical protein